GVVPEPAGARQIAEIVVIPRRGVVGVVLVVSGNGSGVRQVTAPRRIVAVAEIRRAAVLVSQITQRQNVSLKCVEQSTRRQRAESAFADIARREDLDRTRRRRRRSAAAGTA